MVSFLSFCFFFFEKENVSFELIPIHLSFSCLRFDHFSAAYRVDAVYKDTKGDRLVLEHLQASTTSSYRGSGGKRKEKKGKKKKGKKNVERREIMIMPVPIPFRRRQL